jgi:hypothetical protein
MAFTFITNIGFNALRDKTHRTTSEPWLSFVVVSPRSLQKTGYPIRMSKYDMKISFQPTIHDDPFYLNSEAEQNV